MALTSKAIDWAYARGISASTLAALGVDVLSVGALTHGARAVDIALDLEVTGAWAPDVG